MRVVNLAGEALKREDVKRVYSSNQVEQVYNLYGPTETTLHDIREGRGEQRMERLR